MYLNEMKKYDNVIFTDNLDLCIEREKYQFLQENYKIFIIGGNKFMKNYSIM